MAAGTFWTINVDPLLALAAMTTEEILTRLALVNCRSMKPKKLLAAESGSPY